MLRYLGVDAGGTSTRAVLVDDDGTCLGIGRAGSGNPVSSGSEFAAAQVLAASLQAVARAGVPPEAVAGGVVAMAGGRVRAEPGWLNDACRAGGLPGHEVDLVSDGIGWVLGDDGSGFWIGQRVARAALAALDGRGPATTLSSALLEQLGLETDPAGRIEGRTRSVQDAIDVLYGQRPVELAGLAPLAFAAPGDEVAESIVREAGEQLATTLRAVRTPGLTGPLVLAGGVLTRQPALAEQVHALSG